MMFFGLFVLELTLLFMLSKSVTFSLWKIAYFFTRSHKLAITFITLIFFIGTLVHEVAHFLAAGVLLVPVGEINLIPQVHEKGIVLGSVQIGKTDPIRRLLIGVAPVLVGMAVIFSMLLMLKNGTISLGEWWQVCLFIFTIFVISNTMFSSKKDMEGALAFVLAIIVVLAIIFAVLYYTNTLSYLEFLSHLDFIGLESLFKKLGLYMLIPIGINSVFILLSRVVTRFIKVSP